MKPSYNRIYIAIGVEVEEISAGSILVNQIAGRKAWIPKVCIKDWVDGAVAVGDDVVLEVDGGFLIKERLV